MFIKKLKQSVQWSSDRSVFFILSAVRPLLFNVLVCLIFQLTCCLEHSLAVIVKVAYVFVTSVCNDWLSILQMYPRNGGGVGYSHTRMAANLEILRCQQSCLCSAFWVLRSVVCFSVSINISYLTSHIKKP